MWQSKTNKKTTGGDIEIGNLKWPNLFSEYAKSLKPTQIVDYTPIYFSVFSQSFPIVNGYETPNESPAALDPRLIVQLRFEIYIGLKNTTLFIKKKPTFDILY